MFMGAVTRVAVYYRMSTEEQDTSIDRQQMLVGNYVPNRPGYKVVREYKDEGIPARLILKRGDFLRMLEDAKRDEFDVILSDELSRFSRYNPIDFAALIKPIRDKGIILETVKDGVLRWNTASEILMLMFKSSETNTEVVNISRRVLSGMAKTAERGFWTGGRHVPFGYKSVPTYTGEVYQDSQGRRRTRNRKDARLFPDPLYAPHVTWMFGEFAKGRLSTAGMAAELHARGVPRPGGKPWTDSHVKSILKNNVYLGLIHWGEISSGAYHQFVGKDEQPAPVNPGEKVRPARLPQDKLMVALVPHEPLTDQPTFEAVQRVLAAKKKQTAPTGNGGNYLLSGGLLICGHCGHTMGGQVRHDRKGNPHRHYHCNGYTKTEGDHRRCTRNWVDEKAINRAVINKLSNGFLHPDTLRQVWEDYRRDLAAGRKADHGRAAKLEKDRAHHLAELAKMRRVLAREEDDAYRADIKAEIVAEQGKLAKVEADLGEIDRKPDLPSVERQLRLAEQHFQRLRDAMLEAEPAAVRAVLGEFVERVVLWFRPRGDRDGHMEFSHGEIQIRPGEDCVVTRLHAQPCRMNAAPTASRNSSMPSELTGPTESW
jgi:site-specific DNA recombinase